MGERAPSKRKARIFVGLAADAIDYEGAIVIVAGLSAASGLWVAFDMPDGRDSINRTSYF